MSDLKLLFVRYITCISTGFTISKIFFLVLNALPVREEMMAKMYSSWCYNLSYIIS